MKVNHYLVLLLVLFSLCQCTQNEKSSEINSEEPYALITEDPCLSIEETPTNCLQSDALLHCNPSEDAKFKYSATKNSSFIEDNSLSQFYEDHSPVAEAFDYQPERSLKIQCKKGTKVKIPSNAFVLENGEPVKGPIKVEVQEFYSMSDILLSDLTTTSQGKILETGGMLYIEASADGQKCKLANGKRIDLIMPTEERKKGMQLFTGVETDEGIDWLVMPNSTNNVSINRLAKSTSDGFRYEYEHSGRFYDVTETRISRSNQNELEVYSTGTYHPLNKFIAQNVKSPRCIPNNDSVGNRIFVNSKRTTSDLTYGTADCVAAAQFIDGRIFNPKILSRCETDTDLSVLNTLREMRYLRFDEDKTENQRRYLGKNRLLYFVFEFFEQEDTLLYEMVDGNAYKYNGGGCFAAREQKTKQIKPKKKTDLTETVRASSYAFASSKLGWINCDRFIKDDRPKADLIVKVDSKKYTNVKLVFNNIRSVQRGNLRNGNKFKFARLPVGEPVTLIGIQYKEGQAYFAMKETKIGEKTINLEDFKAMSIEEISQKIQALDKLET